VSSRREVQPQPDRQEDGNCPRVGGASGQKVPFPQPDVMPERASASMNAKNGWLVGTSAKVARAGAGLVWRR
jgi:hypothetical protein